LEHGFPSTGLYVRGGPGAGTTARRRARYALRSHGDLSFPGREGDHVHDPPGGLHTDTQGERLHQLEGHRGLRRLHQLEGHRGLRRLHQLGHRGLRRFHQLEGHRGLRRVHQLEGHRGLRRLHLLEEHRGLREPL